MPHIVVEYSDNLETQVKEPDFLPTLHRTVEASGLFNPQAIKARSIGYTHYTLPEGARHFLHVTVSILEGREEKPRRQLADALFSALKKLAPEVDKLSVDIREMDAATYRK